MRPKKVKAEAVSEYIRLNKVVKISELISHFNCSPSTIFRKLKDKDYITSYNLNKQFLTFTDIPGFDTNGLWEYQGARFSKYGGVRPTVKHIVNKSSDGLTAGEINKILHLRVNNQLGLSVKEGRIIRKRYGRFQIYLSTNKSIQKSQIKNREKRTPTQIPTINKDKIIQILVVALKHHITSVERIMPILESEGVRISERIVKWVFKKYQIQKKGSP